MYNPIIPYAIFTKNTPAIPEFYWDVYSSEQRIKNICCELHKLKSYTEYLSGIIDGIEENVNEELESATSEIRQEMRELHDEVLRLIGALEEGMAQWDVQIGKYQTSPDAQRDMFNDVTVHSYNIEELDGVFDDLNMTVDGLANSGINVRAFAVCNHVLKMPDKLPQDFLPDNPKVEGMLTVNGLNNASLDVDGYVFVN